MFYRGFFKLQINLFLSDTVKYDHSVNKLPQLDILFLISIQADQQELQRVVEHAVDKVFGKY